MLVYGSHPVFAAVIVSSSLKGVILVWARGLGWPKKTEYFLSIICLFSLLRTLWVGCEMTQKSKGRPPSDIKHMVSSSMEQRKLGFWICVRLELCSPTANCVEGQLYVFLPEFLFKNKCHDANFITLLWRLNIGACSSFQNIDFVTYFFFQTPTINLDSQV